MSKVFRVTPKRTKRVNGTVLTPEMSVTVTTAQHTSTPFYNGARELHDGGLTAPVQNNMTWCYMTVSTM